ncbi:hydantoinase/oxoprolinase N-terminal domain-containing protein [Agrobacterium vitis]
MRRIGIDVGGTFTDFVVQNTADGTVQYYKLSSTTHDSQKPTSLWAPTLDEQF